LLRSAEKSTSEHAPVLVSGLTPIESCADDVALQRRLPPPRDAQLRGRVNELRTKIDNVAVMFDAGQFREARQALTPLLDQATALGYRPLIAETLFALGRYQDTLGEPALATLEHALWEAEAAGHTELTAAVLTRMITVVGNQGDTERQAVLTKRVEAVLLSLGDPPFLRGELDNSLATLDLANGRFTEALAGFGKAKAAWRLALPARHVSFGGLENNLCIALNQLQRFDEAAEHCRAAVALWRDLLGPRHGDLAKPLGNLGLALAMQGHIDEALDAQRTALELAEASLGATSPMLTGAIAKLANTELAANQPEISLALYQRARALSESQPGGPGVEARDLAEVDNQIGSIQLRLGQPDAALQSFQTARAAFEKTVGPESIQVAATLVNIAQVQASKRQHVQAIATLEQARVLVGKVVGPEQLDYRKMLVMVGQQHLAAGHAVVARGFFEQTLQGTGPDLDAEVQGLAKFGLAQSLWSTGADRSKASALALDAEQLLQRAGVPDVAEVSAWRAKHRRNADER
jgi:serine/threonine-protein kinase